ncbi:MAG: kelch repeat-containing protein [Planctomycetota bacterium]
MTSTRSFSPLSATAFALLVGSALAQTPSVNWLQLPTSSAPSQRYWSHLVLDSARSRLVLFGGGNSVTGQNLGDTWTWDGVAWQEAIPASSPSPRYGQGMAYDEVRSRVVLFGGGLNGPAGIWSDETWEWDGATWTQLTPSVRPSARVLPSMCWDGTNQQVLLFAGKTGNPSWSNETWSWNGAAWTLRNPVQQPPARDTGRMAFDANRGAVVLFGGWVMSGTDNDTWEWDGSNWAHMTPATSPSPRTNHSMCYDAGIQRVVLYGGSVPTGPGTVSDTWSWDGANWTMLPTPTLPSSNAPALAPDPVTGRPLLVVGQTVPAATCETWELVGNPAAAVALLGTGCAGSNSLVPQLAPIPGSLPRLGSDFRTRVQNLPGLAIVIPFAGFTSPGTIPLPLGMPGCVQYAETTFTWFLLGINGSAGWEVRIPALSALTGLQLYMQVAVVDLPANPMGLVVSNGIAATLGW